MQRDYYNVILFLTLLSTGILFYTVKLQGVFKRTGVFLTPSGTGALFYSIMVPEVFFSLKVIIFYSPKVQGLF